MMLLPRHRLDALVDAVLAITMTLLVLQLRLPEDYGGDILGALSMLMPKIISWVVSFLLLALFWQGHIRDFSRVERIDPGIFWLTLLWLMGTSLVPFTSSLIGQHAELAASYVLYGMNLMFIEAIILLRNLHLRRHPELLDKSTTDKHPWALFSVFSVTFCALASMAVATIRPEYAAMVYLLLVPLRRISARVHDVNDE